MVVAVIPGFWKRDTVPGAICAASQDGLLRIVQTGNIGGAIVAWSTQETNGSSVLFPDRCRIFAPANALHFICNNNPLSANHRWVT